MNNVCGQIDYGCMWGIVGWIWMNGDMNLGFLEGEKTKRWGRGGENEKRIRIWGFYGKKGKMLLPVSYFVI